MDEFNVDQFSPTDLIARTARHYIFPGYYKKTGQIVILPGFLNYWVSHVEGGDASWENQASGAS